MIVDVHDAENCLGSPVLILSFRLVDHSMQTLIPALTLQLLVPENATTVTKLH